MKIIICLLQGQVCFGYLALPAAAEYLEQTYLHSGVSITSLTNKDQVLFNQLLPVNTRDIL